MIINQTTLYTQPIYSSKNNEFEAQCFFPLPDKIVDRIKGLSWNQECPVSLNDLSYIQVTHWNMSGDVKVGELVYHQKLALEIIEIFQELFENKFPIEKMGLVDNYQADDHLSMKANNSYAFCSRKITGQTNEFSKHSYGCTIDINPFLNPYIKGEKLLPKGSDNYLDRSLKKPGMIDEDTACYKAFTKRGYIWGGNWEKPYKDYHHFEKNPQVLNHLRDLCSMLTLVDQKKALPCDAAHKASLE